MTGRVTLFALVTGPCLACTVSTEPVSAANCEPAEGRVLTGSLHGEEWEVTVEEFGGFTMLAVTINGQDQGAVEVGESTWYHAGGTSIVVLTGGLPSRTTQAVAVMADGTSLAFCPFGDDELLVAAGAMDADQVVDVELRRGGSVVATGHVEELRQLSNAELFAYNVSPPGVAGVGGPGLVRAPGADLTLTRTSSRRLDQGN